MKTVFESTITPMLTSTPPPFSSLRLHQSSWWCTEATVYPREREDEEEDDAEGWGPKPELFVRWQKLSNTTIAISHSPSLSDYTDHYTAVVLCVGVCLRAVGVWGTTEGEAGHGYNLLCSSTHSARADHYHSASRTVISYNSSGSAKNWSLRVRLWLLHGCVCVYVCSVFRGGSRGKISCLSRSNITLIKF